MAKGDAPIRYTRGAVAVELSWFKYLVSRVWRLTTWGFRRFVKPVFYHPIALLGIAIFMLTLSISPWLPVILVLSTPTWIRPDDYLRHVHPRLVSFLAGFKYRYRPRRMLTANGLLDQKDPVPTISRITKNGCITTMRIRMSAGDEIEYWRERSARLAQTYNAQECTIDPYRRNNLLTFRVDKFLLKPPFVQYHFEEEVTKYRWLNLEFLTKDPFNSKLGVEFLDYHRRETLMPVVATYRDGTPHMDDLGAHRLMIAMTRWGKSNAVRATIYAQRDNVAAQLLENWLIDGKGGVEGAFLENQVARHAYGDTESVDFDPTVFDQLLKDAVEVLMRRQRKMRGFMTEHTPTPDEPWLRIIIDELLVMTSERIPSEIRKSIAASIMFIQEQGVACGVTLFACTQFAQKERLPFRQGFTEFEVGKVERGAVDMIFGSGWWQRGARCDEIPQNLKGVFYRKTDSTMAPREIRYPRATNRDVLDLPKRPDSVLWKPSDKPSFGGVLIA